MGLDFGRKALSLVMVLLYLTGCGSPNVTCETVEARRFILRNEKNKRVGEFGAFAWDGARRLRISDSAPRPLHAVTDTINGLALYDREGRIRVFVGLDAEDSPAVALLNSEGAIIGLIGTDDKDKASVGLYSTSGALTERLPR